MVSGKICNKCNCCTLQKNFPNHYEVFFRVNSGIAAPTIVDYFNKEIIIM